MYCKTCLTNIDTFAVTESSDKLRKGHKLRHDKSMNAVELCAISPVPGVFYGPCSGYDLPIVFRLCGDQINRFVFCDLAYRHRDVSAASAVPRDWTMVSRIVGPDEKQPIKTTPYNGNRPIRPTAIHEVWRRLDGTEAMIELRRDLAEDALVDQFAPRSISVFLHHNDSGGEGGSNLWFLGGRVSSDVDLSGKRLIETLVTRLADGAIVITDGNLADSDFSGSRSFHNHGIDWTPLGIVDGDQRLGHISLAWQARRTDGTID